MDHVEFEIMNETELFAINVGSSNQAFDRCSSTGHFSILCLIEILAQSIAMRKTSRENMPARKKERQHIGLVVMPASRRNIDALIFFPCERAREKRSDLSLSFAVYRSLIIFIFVCVSMYLYLHEV
jgi:hypothetical protein